MKTTIPPEPEHAKGRGGATKPAGKSMTKSPLRPKIAESSVREAKIVKGACQKANDKQIAGNVRNAKNFSSAYNDK